MTRFCVSQAAGGGGQMIELKRISAALSSSSTCSLCTLHQSKRSALTFAFLAYFEWKTEPVFYLSTFQGHLFKLGQNRLNHLERLLLLSSIYSYVASSTARPPSCFVYSTLLRCRNSGFILEMPSSHSQVVTNLWVSLTNRISYLQLHWFPENVS